MWEIKIKTNSKKAIWKKQRLCRGRKMQPINILREVREDSVLMNQKLDAMKNEQRKDLFNMKNKVTNENLHGRVGIQIEEISQKLQQKI